MTDRNAQIVAGTVRHCTGLALIIQDRIYVIGAIGEG